MKSIDAHKCFASFHIIGYGGKWMLQRFMLTKIEAFWKNKWAKIFRCGFSRPSQCQRLPLRRPAVPTQHAWFTIGNPTVSENNENFEVFPNKFVFKLRKPFSHSIRTMFPIVYGIFIRRFYEFACFEPFQTTLSLKISMIFIVFTIKCYIEAVVYCNQEHAAGKALWLR